MAKVGMHLDYYQIRCLKITEKVVFNIHCIHFEWTKVDINNAKNGPFWRVLKNLKLAAKE